MIKRAKKIKSSKSRKDKNSNNKESAQEKLSSARFRFLNEMLYMQDSERAFHQFQKDPSLFYQYHNGFRQQVARWPSNPLDIITKLLEKWDGGNDEKFKNQPDPLVVADLGCGDAELSKRLSDYDNLRYTIHSFDLVPANNRVTAANIKSVPLSAGSVDVAVFCLSLMGTDCLNFLIEANRILKIKGHLIVAEVKSRIEDLQQFTDSIEKLGFKLKWKDKDFTNQMFVMMDFTKLHDFIGHSNRNPEHGYPSLKLKPCHYKKR